MSYYDTIDDDLKRAKEILARGRTHERGCPAIADDESDYEHLDDAGHCVCARALGGTIYGGDVYAAYKLLESFVAEIERLRAEGNAWKNAIIDAAVVDWIYTKEHEADPRKAVNDLLAWQQQIALDPRVSKPAYDLQTEMLRLRELVDAVGEKVCELALRHKRLHGQSPDPDK